MLKQQKQKTKKKYIYIYKPSTTQPTISHATPPENLRPSNDVSSVRRDVGFLPGIFWGDGHFVARRSWIGGTSIWRKNVEKTKGRTGIILSI